MAKSEKSTQRAARDARLAAALRENLKRRKEQARQRRQAAIGRIEPAEGGSAPSRKK